MKKNSLSLWVDSGFVCVEISECVCKHTRFDWKTLRILESKTKTTFTGTI